MTNTPDPQALRYRQRPIECDAIQWTGSNADALRAFAGPDFDTIDPEDRIDDPDQDAQLLVEASHWVGIRPTDWVLKFEGYFVAKRDETFRAVWEPVPAAETTNRAALREQIAETLARADGWEYGPGLGLRDMAPSTVEHYDKLADAVLAVLPAAADRAAILREAADAVMRLDYMELRADFEYDSQRDAWDGGTIDAAALLRRMADDAPAPSRVAAEEQPETQAVDRPSCTCQYIAESWIKMDHASDCPVRPVTPMDPVHILGIGATTERPVVGEQPDTHTHATADTTIRAAELDDTARLLYAAGNPDGAEILQRRAELIRAVGKPRPEVPRRGDPVEAWLKTQRDRYDRDGESSEFWHEFDAALDLYRLHAGTGTPLTQHVCEGQAVGDCECLEQPAAVSQPGKEA
ncbi:hypothetical protein [Streptomyces sp. NPDC001315]|uniref:hypothetical protein n=1 Tax=Streptomyces sp. NPDC001315 TaxID=3364562 RepID=UPI0036BC9F24